MTITDTRLEHHYSNWVYLLMVHGSYSPVLFAIVADPLFVCALHNQSPASPVIMRVSDGKANSDRERRESWLVGLELHQKSKSGLSLPYCVWRGIGGSVRPRRAALLYETDLVVDWLTESDWACHPGDIFGSSGLFQLTQLYEKKWGFQSLLWARHPSMKHGNGKLYVVTSNSTRPTGIHCMNRASMELRRKKV